MNKRLKIGVVATALLLCVAGGFGCGKNPQGRKAIQGTIKLDGTPIADGTIEFLPEKSNEPQTNAGAKITNGAYSIAAEKGLVDGTYKVAVSARVDTGETAEGSLGPTPVYMETIPDAYGAETEQTTTVSGKGPIIFDLDVPAN